MTAQTIPARRLPLLWIETENNCPAASGHRGYHKEVKTASFQGKSITVENLTPMLSPRARDKRKREIESCLYEVFVKYAPGRAQMH